MLRSSCLLAALLLAAAPAHADPAAARGQWDLRAEEQRTQLDTLQQRANRAAQAFMAAEELDATVATAEAGGVYSSTRAAGILAGRSEMLQAWRAYLASNPSASAAGTWVARRTDELKAQTESVVTSEENLKALVAAGGSNSFTVVVGLDRLYRMGSYTEGAALELQRIGGELAGYYGAPALQSADWQGSVAGLAETLNREQAALEGWSRTCTPRGLTIACGG